eukprot:CAMPEP_0119305190 /NCGR_PEP_ID=MMETSP1333-20130426/6243_1 /TAXON_ID=418940 /ORGANISM="Scyphosphaera apsteinii, Strain RCC1455" /LENGTH=257 /DNA_ID=CAMNT_0007308215 /DNA_START=179 /DNA_END=949 /DNA_ORIENTATION=-
MTRRSRALPQPRPPTYSWCEPKRVKFMGFANDSGCEQLLPGEWYPFAAPPGVAYFGGECEEPVPGNLGTNYAILPVSHMRVKRSPIGLWFYHLGMGCSDLGLNVGRTLLVKNRCHVALVLQQQILLHHIGGIKGSVAEASAHIASKLLSVGASGQQRAVLNAIALAQITSHDMLDAINWQLLIELHGRGQGFDTIQLSHQQQGAGSIRWTTEVWDVRRTGEALAAEQHFIQNTFKQNVSANGSTSRIGTTMASTPAW